MRASITALRRLFFIYNSCYCLATFFSHRVLFLSLDTFFFVIIRMQHILGRVKVGGCELLEATSSIELCWDMEEREKEPEALETGEGRKPE